MNPKYQDPIAWLIELAANNGWNSFHRKQRNAVLFTKGGNDLDVTFLPDHRVRSAEFNGSPLPETVVQSLVVAVLS